MTIIDFRVRPPYKEFLGTAMYGQAERRDRITRSLGFEPSSAAVQQSVELMLAEMDAAGVDFGVVSRSSVRPILTASFRSPRSIRPTASGRSVKSMMP